MKMEKIMMLSLFIFITACQQRPATENEEQKIYSPKYIQRTMNLLATSTPQLKNTVRILVYGQSLSAQDWWLQVKDHLEDKFPDANLIMDNKSIGGFSSQILIRTVKRDVLDFYPDLIIFHVFGSDKKYEEVLVQMRSQTAAEIMIWNDPPNKVPPSEWNTEMSYEIVPALAEKYHCKLIDLRTPIREMLKEEGLVYADEFTRDGTHFNEKGCDLIASLIIPHLVYDDQYPPDPDELLTIYEINRDVRWENGELELPFEGNRIDVVTGANPDSQNTCRIRVDGKKPSEFPEAYNHTRPNDNGKGGWIWSVGAPVRIGRETPWVNETFTLTFDSLNYEDRYLTFHVEGSDCGYEGKGNNHEDYISNSGRVVIEANEVNDSIPGDWHVFRNYDVLEFQIEKGYQTKWKTYLMGMDTFVPESVEDESIENSTTLIKGIPNAKHTLKLISTGDEVPDIRYIKIYRPFL